MAEAGLDAIVPDGKVRLRCSRRIRFASGRLRVVVQLRPCQVDNAAAIPLIAEGLRQRRLAQELFVRDEALSTTASPSQF
jgi:DNA gyrase/topoisomerase IV subunit A